VAILLLILIFLFICGLLFSSIAHAETVASSGQRAPGSILPTVGWVIAFFGVVCSIIQSVRINKISKYRQYEDEQYEKKLKNKEAEIQSLKLENSNLKSLIESKSTAYDKTVAGYRDSYNNLKKKYDELYDRYNMAIKLHENLDAEIDEEIQKENDEKNM